MIYQTVQRKEPHNDTTGLAEAAKRAYGLHHSDHTQELLGSTTRYIA